MSMGFWFLLTLAPAALAAALTGGVRRFALRRRMLDVPNERSSHDRPTPRGGGLSIVLVALAGMGILVWAGLLPARTGAAVAAGGVPVAVIGWIDDRRGLSPLARAAVQFAAATAAVYLLGGLPRLEIGGAGMPLGALGAVLAVVGTVWAINLYNFMDGIDGLAAGHAAVAAAAAAALLARVGAQGLAAAALLVGAASAGFLFWNWPPARIFMGDVGSGFLGFVFAVLAIASENGGGIPLLVWLILLYPFIFDATLTLTRRVLTGARWHLPHRSHAYQRAVESGASHRAVTLAILGLDGLMAVAAWLIVVRPAHAGSATLAVTALLAAIYIGIERRRPMHPSPVPPEGLE